jgi:uncharacterized protein DUF4388
MPGLSKVIVLDPDARAGRQVQLGFEREGIPAALVAPLEPRSGENQDDQGERGGLCSIELPADDTGLVVVGGCDGQGIDLVRQARGWLDAHRVDAPIVFAGRGVLWSDATGAGADEVLRHPAYLRDVVTIGRLLRGVPAGRRDHIAGNLVDVTGVFTLVRALSALGRSATLTLVRGLRRGEVRFYHGEVTSAQVGMIHGQAALHQLLLWTDARFDFHHQDVVRRQQIPLSPDELFADAERFLEGVRESSGGLSPAMVLEQDVPRLQALAKQIPTEVYGVLRMFDGHRAIADVLEDSAYRVFETLRVAQRAVEAGLLRAVETQPRRPSWRAFLAIEDWLVGNEPRDAAGDSGPVSSSRDAMAVTVRDARGAPPAPAAGAAGKGRKKKKRKPPRNTPRAIAIGAVAPREIDWGLLVPRIVGAEVGPLAGVVPASQVAGEIVTTAALRAPGAAAGSTGGGGSGQGGEPSVVFDEAAELAREAASRRVELEAHSEVERIAAGARAAAEAERAAEPQHARERALAAAEAERTAAGASAVADAERSAAALAAADTEAAAAAIEAVRAAEAHADAIRIVAATVSVSSEPARVAADMDLIETKRERGLAPGSPSRDAAAASDGVAPAAAITEPLVACVPPGNVSAPLDAVAPPPVTERSAAALPSAAITEPLVAYVPPGAITEPLTAAAPPGATIEPRAAVVPPGAATEPRAALVPPGTITEPLVAYVPPGAITEPIAAVVPPAAITEPLVAYVPPGAITEPIAAVVPPAAITEPLVAYVPPGAAAEPIAPVVPPAAITESGVASVPPGAITEPRAAVVPPGAITEPFTAVVPPGATTAPLTSVVPPSASTEAPGAAVSPDSISAALDPGAPRGVITEPLAAAAAPDADRLDASSAEAIAAPFAAVTFSGAITAPLTAAVAPAADAEAPAGIANAGADAAPGAIGAPSRAAAAPDAGADALDDDDLGDDDLGDDDLGDDDLGDDDLDDELDDDLDDDDLDDDGLDDDGAADSAPSEVSDEPSDGVVRHHIATAKTAPVRRRPPSERVDDDRPGDATGEITMPRQRPVREIRYSEPTILVADLATVQAAVSGVIDAQAATSTPDAASAEHASPVAEVVDDAAEVHGDAAAFSDAEEAFFRAGHDRGAPPAATPKAESFDDLDEGYRRVGFWERFRGKPIRPKGPRR